MSKKDETRDCAISECWKRADRAGYCYACYSGINRLQTLTLHELDRYIRKVRRLNDRAGKEKKKRVRPKLKAA